MLARLGALTSSAPWPEYVFRNQLIESDLKHIQALCLQRILYTLDTSFPSWFVQNELAKASMQGHTFKQL